MYTVLLAIISLSLTDVSCVPQEPASVTPIKSFLHGTGVGQTNRHHSTRDFHEHEAALTNSHQKQGIAVEASPSNPNVEYGLPPDGQSLKNWYHQGQQHSDLQNSDKSIKYNVIQGSANSDQLRSFPHELSNEELILSYVPPVVSRTFDQYSGLEYADYAPYHHEKYSAGIAKSEQPSHPSQSPREGYDKQPYQNQHEISEHSSNSYPPSEGKILTSDDNSGYGEHKNQRVPSRSEEVTFGPAPESEGPYQSYRYSQDAQQSETDTKFQNPSYSYPQYEVPTVSSQTEATFRNPEYEAPPMVSDFQRSQTVKSFQNPSYPNQNYEVGAVVAIADRSQAVNSFKNPSYTNPKLPAVASDVQRSQTETAFDNPDYKALPVVSDFQRSQKEESFPNPSNLNLKYDAAPGVLDVQRSKTEESLHNPSQPNPKYEAVPGVSNVQRSQSVTSFQNPSYPNPKYEAAPGVLDVQLSRTEESLHNPSYQNPKYEAAPMVSDGQHFQTEESFRNPSYPNTKYEAAPGVLDVQLSRTEESLHNPSYPNPKYEAAPMVSDGQHFQTEESFRNPSYPNTKYEAAPGVLDVQLSRTKGSLHNPSYPNPKYEAAPGVSDVQRSKTDESLYNPSYPNPKYDAAPGVSEVQRSKSVTSFQNLEYEAPPLVPGEQRSQYVTSFQNPSSANSKYGAPVLGLDVQHSRTESKSQNPSYQAYGVPPVVSQNAKTATAQQSFVAKYENVKVGAPEIIRPAVQRPTHNVPSYPSSNGHRSVIYDHQAPQGSQTFDFPGAATYNSKSSYGLPVYSPSGADSRVRQTLKPDSAPRKSLNSAYEASPYQTGQRAGYEAPERYETHSQSPLIGYTPPVRYIAVFQNHRAPGKADISTASYLTQALHDQPQTQTGRTVASSYHKAGVPIVLPMSPYDYRDSPAGSISSTFISKDVGGETHPVAPAYRRDPSPQTAYGIPNF